MNTACMSTMRPNRLHRGHLYAGSPRPTSSTPLANCHFVLRYVMATREATLGSRGTVIRRALAVIITGLRAVYRELLSRARILRTAAQVPQSDDGVEDGQRSRRVRVGTP